MKVGESTSAAGVSAPQTAPETNTTAEPGKFAGVLAKKGEEVKQEGDAKADPPLTGDAAPSPFGELPGKGMPAKTLPGTGLPATTQAPGSKAKGKVEESTDKDNDKELTLEERLEADKYEATDAEEAPSKKLPSEPQPQLIPQQILQNMRTEAPHPVTETRQVRALVQEIQTVVHPSGKMQVDIQLDSQTFEGLQIRVTRDESGKIAVQFNTQSTDVSQMLERNVPALSQSLAARGYQVASVQIVNPALSTPQAQLQAQQINTPQPVQTPQRSSEERAFRDGERGRGGEGGGEGGGQGRERQQQRGQR